MDTPLSFRDILGVGTTVAISTHPASAVGRQAVRYWLTEVAGASVDPQDRPVDANTFLVQEVGVDFIRLVQGPLESAPGHPPIVLPLSAIALLNV